MAKAKKLQSGSWNAKVYDYTDNNGKRYYKSITANTKAECEYLAAQFKKNKAARPKTPTELTVGEAVDKYIDKCTKLSPTTIESYHKIRERAFPSLMNIQIKDLNEDIINSAIDTESNRLGDKTGKPISAKTVKNEWCLIATAIRDCSKLSFNVDLPKIIKRKRTLPEPEEILEAIVGTEVELPCLLAMWLSFSMSEIRGLTCKSVYKDYIYINQVMVDVNNEPIIKDAAKTPARLRKQTLPAHIKELINNTENYKSYLADGVDRHLVDMTREQIRSKYRKALESHGISEISFHDLRHFFASIMLTKLNIPDRIVQDEGGWVTPHIMKSVYSESFDSSRFEADALRDSYFDNIIKNTNAS